MGAQKTQDYIDGVLARKRAMIAKTITMIESALPEHQKTAQEVLDALIPYAGNAVRIGITGVPGVGKSTFIESFGMMLAEKNHRVAVLAVDPSSSKSGGASWVTKPGWKNSPYILGPTSGPRHPAEPWEE